MNLRKIVFFVSAILVIISLCSSAAYSQTISGHLTVCLGASRTTLTCATTGGTWSSADVARATIDAATGVVTGVSAGTATISYELPSSSFITAVVTVNFQVMSPIGFSMGSASRCTGGATATCTVSPTFGNAWASSDVSIATINTGGLVTPSPTNAGTTTISYRHGTGNCYVTREVSVNTTPTVTATTSMCNGTTQTVTATPGGGAWSSSNTSVGTVNSTTGVMSALAGGGTTIYNTATTGCVSSRYITVLGLPGAITGTTTICEGNTSTLSSSTSGGTWSSSNTSVATIGTSGVVSAIAAGTTTITYAVGSGCMRTTVVTVNAGLPSNTGLLTVCTGQTSTLSNAASGGTWSSSAPSKATVVTATGVVTGIAAGTANISYRVGAGCSSVSVVTVNATMAAIGGSSSVCVGASMTLTHAVGGGTWSSSNANATIGSTSGILTGVTAGAVVITYYISSGCYKTMAVTVKAVPSAIAGTATVCPGASTTLSSATGGGTWSSSNTGVATVGSSTGVVTGITGGVTTISYTVTSTGCFATRQVTVNSTGGSISGTSDICVGSTSVLSCSPGGGTWTSGNPSVATIGSSSGVVAAVSAGTSAITYGTGSGCVSVAIVTVDTPEDAGMITGASTVDVVAAITLSSSVSGGIWSSSATAIASVGSTTGVVTGIAEGVATVSYTLVNSCGSVSATKTVTVSIAAISGTLTVCPGSTTNLTDASTGGSWISGNTLVATIGSGSGVATGISAGTCFITYLLGGSSTVAVLTVSPLPDAGALSGTLTVYADGTTALSSTVGGGAWSSSDSDVAVVGPTGIVNGITSGTAVVSYAVANGCGTAIVTTVVTVSIAPITGTLIACTGATTALSSASAGGTWTSGNPSVASIGSGSGIVFGVAAGTANITYSIGSSYVTAILTINLTADAGTLSGAATLVPGGSATLTSSVAGGTWSSSSTAIATVGSAGIVTGIGNGTATIYYIVTASCAPDTAFHTITVYTIPSTPPSMSLSASSGHPGNSITISGSGFSSVASFNSVWFSGARGTVTAASATSLTVTIPVGAGYGPVSVTNLTNGLSVFSQSNFTPTFDNSIYVPGVVNFNNALQVQVPGGYGQGIAIGDLDGDGKSELVAANSSDTGMTIFYNISSPGSLSSSSFSRIYFVFGAAGYAVAIHDMDGDGKPDIILSASGGMRIFRNIHTAGAMSTSSFSAPVTLSGLAVTPVIEDIDGDGKPDIIGSFGTTLLVSRNNCTPGSITSSSFASPVGFAVNGDAVQTAVGDIDGDGKKDVVVAGFPSTNIAVLRNTSTPGVISFAPKYDLPAIDEPYGVVVGDFSMDGKPDIAINRIHGYQAAAYLNIASPGSISAASFGSSQYVETPYCYPLSIGASDINGDGKVDLLIGDDFHYDAVVSLNASPGPGMSFSGYANFSLGGGGYIYPHHIIAGDLDGDSKPDIVTSNLFTGNLSILRNNPVPAILGPSSLCTAATATYSIVATGGTWTSLTPAIASVGSSTGVVTGLAPGEARIRYSVPGGFVSDKAITVNPFAGYVAGSSSVTIGGTITAFIYLYGGGAITGGVWSSSNPGIASVGSTGIISGVGVGTATISYSVAAPCGTAVSTKVITVNPVVTACSKVWNTVGTAGFSAGLAEYPSVAVSAGGVPYIAFSDWGDGHKVYVKKLVGGAWVNVGGGSVSDAGSRYTKLVLNSGGVPYVAYKDSANGRKATVKMFNGTSWVAVGTEGLSAGEVEVVSLDIDGSGMPYVAYADHSFSYRAIVKKYNGSSWVDVGGGFATSSGVGYLDMAIDGSGNVFVATNAGALATAEVSKYNGTSWSIVGASGISVEFAEYISIAVGSSGIPYLAYSDAGRDHKGVVKKYNGSSWVDVGSGEISSDWVYSTDIAVGASDTPYVAFSDLASYRVALKKYNGTSWVSVGTTPLSAGWGEHVSMDLDNAGVPYVGYFDYTQSNRVTVRKYANSASAPGAISGASTVVIGANTTLSCSPTGGIWSSSDPGIATVNGSGVVTGVATGSATISYAAIYSCDTVFSVKPITVNPVDPCNSWQLTGNAGFSAGTAHYISLAIDGSGTPYVSYEEASDGDKATVMKYNPAGAGWETVGSASFSAGSAGYLSLALNGSGTPYVAYRDGSLSNRATVKKYNPAGAVWETVGSAGFSAGIASYTSLAIDGSGTPYVAYSDGSVSNKATVKKYNPAGAGWETVGSVGFSAGIADQMSLVTDGSGTPYVAYIDGSVGNKATVKKYNPGGAGWETVGSVGFSAGSADYLSLAIDGSGTPYVAYRDASVGGKTTVMKYNPAGAGWETVGSAGFSAGIAQFVSLAISGSGTPYVAYMDFSVGLKATVKKYNPSGAVWETVGSTGISADIAYFSSIALNGSGVPYLAYIDEHEDEKATVMKYASGFSPITGALTLCAGATTTLSHITAGGSWSSGATSIATVGSTGIVTGVAEGTAVITYTVGDCSVTTIVSVNCASREVITKPYDATSAVFSVAPNPTTGRLNIWSGVTGAMTIYTIDGREVLTQGTARGTTNLVLPENLAAGIYMLRFKGVDGSTQVVRLVYEP